MGEEEQLQIRNAMAQGRILSLAAKTHDNVSIMMMIAFNTPKEVVLYPYLRICAARSCIYA